MTIHGRIEGEVAIIGIDRPEARGALRLADWQALADAIGTAMADDAVKALVLTGRDRHFCAGADIGEIAHRRTEPGWAEAKYAAVRACNRGLALGPKPVVAAIGGDAIGGGCGLALAADVRIAHPAARFGITPARLGVAYARFDTALLVAAVGHGEARRLLTTAALIDAGEASRIGLVHRLADDPLAAALAEAAVIARLSAHSIAHSKAMLGAMLADDDDASRAAFISAYARGEMGERAAAFGKAR